MADRRRRSPESSVRGGKDYNRPNYYYNEPPRMEYGAASLSSSSSSSYLDISRTFPNRSGIRTFFTAPSERRRLRRRRSSKLLKLNNSSSSSINSDLAYGTGFIKRPKGRGVRSRKGKDIDREKHRDIYRDRESFGPQREKERSGVRDGISRATTDAEILAVGAGLAKLAREQNKLDLRGGRNGKRTDTYGVTPQPSGYNIGSSRGLGPSKVSHGSDTVDEDGWESASDAESESSVDSRLAFGGDTNADWFGWGKPKYQPQSRKSSIVDPRLFGPANSLNGVLTQPVGFGDVTWSSSSDFGQRGWAPAGPPQGPQGPVASVISAATSSQAPLQYVYPVPTSDPSRFEAARSSVVSGAEPYISSRPAPIPLQQPQPIAPVSQSVYEPIYATRGETSTVRSPNSSSRSQSLAQAALMGVAGAAVGAAIASDRKDDRKDKRRDDRESRDYDRGSKRHEKRDSPEREERREKRHEKERQKDSADDQRREKKREKRRDDGRDEGRDERREKRREERRNERSDDRYESRRTKSETSISTTSVDPFQYQVADDAFPTPVIASPIHGNIETVPTVVTVDREPNFSRVRSSSIKDQPVFTNSDLPRDEGIWDKREQRYKERDSRDRTLHDAEAIYQETEHSTAPIEVAAIGAAVAAEAYRESRSNRRRDERRGERRETDDYDSTSRRRDSTRESTHDREPERDHIQEEADRAYREIIMARKIASQVIRSRSPSPDPSVVRKYDKDNQEEEIIRIVTPPGMEDHKKEGPYDAPNADFKLDLVLEDPRELRNFSIPSVSIDGSGRVNPYLKRDPDALEPRPHLNLVRPTPTPSPIPEKQAARSESRKPSNQDTPTVILDNKGNVVASPTSSTVSKAVTWGENETKHYEVESPHEHRDEFVSNKEIQARERDAEIPAAVSSSEKPKSSDNSKRGGWSAIAAGIIGAGVGAGVGSSDTSDNSKSKDNQSSPKEKYKYRGVVVEPESPPRRKRSRSPPSTGPKPTIVQPSHIPGAFEDDLDFTATVAAGLQDTGFDPNIVINDPSFRRRASPPGSNQSGIYKSPFSETVSDLGSVPPSADPNDSSRGLIMGEVIETPKGWRSVSPDNDDFSSKLSKKEQKKRDKAAKRQSGDFTPLIEEASSRNIVEEPESYFETTKLSKKEQKKRDKAAQKQGSQSEDVTPVITHAATTSIVEEPETYFEISKKSKKKSKRHSSAFEDAADDDEGKVSVSVDAFDDLRTAEDEWTETKKSKKKSKRDGDLYETSSRSAPPEAVSELEKSSSKKSKDKSRRKSSQYESEADPTEIALPPSTPSENSRDGDFEESRKSRKSSRKDSADRDDSRSVVSADASRYDDEPRKSKKKSRSSARDDFDDTRSVASAPAGDDYEDPKKKKKEKRNSGSFFGLFGSKSESGARDESPRGAKDDFDEVKKKSKKSKRNSVPDDSGLYGESGSQSVTDISRVSSNGNGHSNGSYHDEDANGRSRIDDDDKKASRSRGESQSSKKDSFLASAGTLGAGVGLAGAVVAIASQHFQQSKADDAGGSERTQGTTSGRSVIPQQQHYETIDPEITQRQFRPAIDPQYGDLLPLPPSDPGSPIIDSNENLPGLPDSRPTTPEKVRLYRDKILSSVRKNVQETPMKSPSQSAVPLKFIMGNRSTPSSPAPLRSPATPREESLNFPRNRPRPTSWDSTKEYKPLYLVETNRRRSTNQLEPEDDLPALPLSQSTSRSSSRFDSGDFTEREDNEEPFFNRSIEPLSINTSLDSIQLPQDLLDSQQSTPKAEIRGIERDYPITPLYADPEGISDLPKSPVLPIEQSMGALPDQDDGAVSSLSWDTELISSIGYFASSPRNQPTKKSWLHDLPSRPSIASEPSPVEPMTKDRSSYLLQSSPLSRQTEGHPDETEIESPIARHLSQQSEDDVMRGPKDRADDHMPWTSFSSNFEAVLPTDSLTRVSGQIGEEIKEVEKNIAAPDGDLIVGKDTIRGQEIMDAEEQQAQYEPVVKSKKDKKKDKKKAKGLSRSGMMDERPPQEDSIGDPHEIQNLDPTSLMEGTGVPSEQLKNKSYNNFSSSSLQDHTIASDSPPNDSQKLPNDFFADPKDTLATKTSKKDKKKDKKKSRSFLAWETPEGNVESQAAGETPLTTGEDNSHDAPEDDNLWTTDSKNSKKKDKKKARSAAILDPEYDNIVQSNDSIPQDFEKESTSVTHPDRDAGIEKGISSLKDEDSLALSQDISTDATTSEAIISQESQDSPTGMPQVIGDGDDEVKASQSPATANGGYQPESTEFQVEPAQDAAKSLAIDDSDMIPTPTEVAMMETSKKGKKKKKGKSGLSWEPEDREEYTPDATPATTPAAPVDVDYFGPAALKKSKKKKKDKSGLLWEPEEGEDMTSITTPSAPPADVDLFESVSSKKSKQKGKSSDYRASESIPPEGLPESEQPIDAPRIPLHDTSLIVDTSDFEQGTFFLPGSKKKKGKYSKKHQEQGQDTKSSQAGQSGQSFEPILATSAPISDELPQEEVHLPPTHQSPVEGLKMSPFSTDPSNEVPKDIIGSELLSQKSDATEDLPSQKATPVGGPGAWPITPATPWAGAAPDASESASEDYFPSSAALHTPQGGGTPDDAENRGYFPSARALLPFAFAGATMSKVAEPTEETDNLPNKTLEEQPFEPPANEEPYPESQDRSLPRDGFKAGYDETQLSLARRLQEEFSGGSKKSKKDKKKRQSLPSTPESELPRSRRAADDIDHLRARSLSIEPSVTAEDTEEIPSGHRKSIFGEDQLEFARQLKAEFESGNKRSKKDKKKRPGLLSRSSTQDESFSDPMMEEPQAIVSDPIDHVFGADSPSKADGLAAGYQEAQLSLARQLQAEFGSGSKKSKKDKKRRSTSQTPTQDQEPVDDGDNGEAYQSLGPNRSENSNTAIDTQHTTRDGLAVGYSEDQLELARKLKDEFGSSTKKTKKDKKRQSTLRGSFDDMPVEDQPPIESPISRDLEDIDTDPVRAQAVEQDKDEFVVTKKKYKKDKKGKKREVVAPTPSSSGVLQGSEATDKIPQLNDDATRVEERASIDAPVADTLDDLPTSVLLRASVDDVQKVIDENRSENFAKEAEALHNAHYSETTDVDSKPNESSATPLDTKLLGEQLREQKQYENPAISQAPPDAPDEMNSQEIQDSNAQGSQTETAVGAIADFTGDLDEDFGFTSKKSKKDKRKQKNRLLSNFDEPAQLPADETSPAADLTRDLSDETSGALTPSLVSQDSEFIFTSKKSQKDKKKRQNAQPTGLESLAEVSAPTPPASDQISENMKGSDNKPIIETNLQTFLAQTIPPENEETAEDFFAEDVSTSKKSKRDRKKANAGTDESLKKSGATIPLDQTDMSVEATDSWSQKEIPIDGNDAEGSSVPVSDHSNSHTNFEQPTQDAQDDDEWGGFSLKKSKKDKRKKKNSGLSTPAEPTTATPEHSDNAIQDVEHDEWSGFSVKKSKKNKHDKNSAVSTPTEPAIIIPEPENILEESQESVAQSTPEDDWSGYSVKKSKKDKKKKSLAVLSPAEPTVVIVEPEKLLAESQEPTAKPTSDDEWGGFSLKKSKKDKKKKKSSGFSTPAETSIDTSEPRPLIEEPEASTAAPAEDDDWGAFSVKESKEDKKKRDAKRTTTDSEFLEPKEDSQRSMAQSAEDTLSHSTDLQRGETHNGSGKGLEFVSKAFDKDEENQGPSIITPLDENPAPETGLILESATTLNDNIEVSQMEDLPRSNVDSPIAVQSFSDPPHIISDITNDIRVIPEPDPSSTSPSLRELEFSLSKRADLEPDVALPGKIEVTSENDEVTTRDVGRKLSKKDKRKRQSTGKATEGTKPGATEVSTTSWADEVEEATTGQDNSVTEATSGPDPNSHISDITGIEEGGEFSRPTKKGKGGKKSRKSEKIIAESSLLNNSFRPPIGDDFSPVVAETKDITLSEVVATSSPAGTIPILVEVPRVAEVPPSPPTRKLSKKEKRKKSIDRRSVPQDDIFDDPVLWEGDKPQIFEEPNAADDSAGSDGFWSTPLDAADDSMSKEILGGENETLQEQLIEHKLADTADHFPKDMLTTGETDHQAIGDLTQKIAESSESISRKVAAENNDRPSNFEGVVNDLPDDFIKASIKKDKKKEKQNRLPKWNSPDEQLLQRDNSPAADITPSSVPPPSWPAPQQTFAKESIGHEEDASTLVHNPMEDAPMDDNKPGAVSFEQEHTKGLAIGNVIQPRASRLPAVREESPDLSDAQDVTPHFSHTLPSEEPDRDSAFVAESPILLQKGFTDTHEHVRDSGVHLRDLSSAPTSATDDAIAKMSWPEVDEEADTVNLHKSQQPIKGTTPQRHEPDHRSRPTTPKAFGNTIHNEDRSLENQDSRQGYKENKTAHHEKSPEDNHPQGKSTEHQHTNATSRDLLPSQKNKEEHLTDLHRTQRIHSTRSTKESGSVKDRVQRFESPDLFRSQKAKGDKYAELNVSQKPKAEKPVTFDESGSIVAPGAALAGASIGFAAARQASREHRPASVGNNSNRSSPNINRLRTPDPKYRPDSATSNRSSAATPPLRRSDRKSGDLRSLSQQSHSDLAKEAERAAIITAAAAATSTTSTTNPQANEGRARAKDMADVYDGFGEGRMGSPRSPTRPHSMRRRQSMQVLDLEQRLEQMAAENRMLADANAQAERTLLTNQHHPSAIVERDAEIESLKRTLEWLQNEVTRLTEVNDGLTSANLTLGTQHNDRYGVLVSQHAQTTRELQEMQDSHKNLSAGMEGIVKNEIQNAVQDKDREIAQLRADLEAAKDQIRAMQRQILESKANDSEFLTIRDEDYFDTACQQLCQHVQQWVLRFSKFSDMRACRLTSEINNDKTIDRLDNAILDGSDVDSYLADRVKRRDVFMSMTMTMVWEFVFTRYLFGMDREQRQKLKSLEKLLSEVGPAAAVHQWRATTLTLLSKREAFVQQREQDTLAVVNAILETLTEILPPPSHLEDQIQEQLVRVMKAAVELSIEMRTQRAEYMMLPPLQPEYDANGDLASKVSFNAALMNERSGDTVSNEELEEAGAVVRIVLFPLVVKKGDDQGEGDEEIVVCPAQVLVAKPKKTVRVFSPESMAQQNHSRISMQSSMPADYGDGSVI